MEIKAINLLANDVLTATGTTIIVVPRLLNPAGARNLPYKETDIVLTVRYSNGKESVRIWNKNTSLKIQRPTL